MSGWTQDAVLAAEAAWVWVPPDAKQVRTDDYQLVAYPRHYLTFPVAVLWSRSSRPVSELIDEVAGHIRAWGDTEVRWTVTAATRPEDTEAELLRRGATLAETSLVLAYDMTDGLPALDEPADVDWALVDDEASVRAHQRVSLEVWGDGGEPTEADLERGLEDARKGLAGWSDFSVVGSIGGEPASHGGCTLVDGVARLWGAGTRETFRGRGAYRVVLGRRLALARAHGATLALVKGRVSTSAPILARAGFKPYGEQRDYQIDLGGDPAR